MASCVLYRKGLDGAMIWCSDGLFCDGIVWLDLASTKNFLIRILLPY